MEPSGSVSTRERNESPLEIEAQSDNFECSQAITLSSIPGLFRESSDFMWKHGLSALVVAERCLRELTTKSKTLIGVGAILWGPLLYAGNLQADRGSLWTGF